MKTELRLLLSGLLVASTTFMGPSSVRGASQPTLDPATKITIEQYRGGRERGDGGRRGPGQTGGVGLGGPGGNGPGGPGSVGGPGNFGSAGFGGRGGGGGLSGIGPGGQPRQGGLGLGGGLGVGNNGGLGGLLNRPGGLGPGQNRLGLGGVGSGNNNPRPDNLGPESGLGGLGPGGLNPGTGIGGFLFGNGNFEIPRSPAVFENLGNGQAAQQAAQNAAEQGQEAIDQAVAQAQDAYEQMWEDYYEAVDYAAEMYYDSVTGAIDYGAETYEEYYNQAVAQAQQAVNSYYEYYNDYLTYSEMYPWDSYAYTYDEATGQYVTNETVNNYYYNYTTGSSESAADITIPTSATVSQAVTTLPIPQAPAPSQEAYETIVVFANDQLGAVVTPAYAGEVTQETLALLASLPAQAQNPLYNAQNMAVQAYYGLLNGGVAGVALGDCSEGASCQLSGDIPADISSAALGSYALTTAEAMPASPGDALELITLVYPKLTGLQFTQATDVPGYAFSAMTSSVALENGQPTIVAKAVFAGVINANGRTIVYATVGLGEAYAQLAYPFPK